MNNDGEKNINGQPLTFICRECFKRTIILCRPFLYWQRKWY